MSVKFVKIASDWVSPSDVVAVERRPGGGSRIHLRSGTSLAYGDTIDPDDVIRMLFEAEGQGENR